MDEVENVVAVLVVVAVDSVVALELDEVVQLHELIRSLLEPFHALVQSAHFAVARGIAIGWRHVDFFIKRCMRESLDNVRFAKVIAALNRVEEERTHAVCAEGRGVPLIPIDTLDLAVAARH